MILFAALRVAFLTSREKAFVASTPPQKEGFSPKSETLLIPVHC